MEHTIKNDPINWQQCLQLSNHNAEFAKELLTMFMAELPDYQRNIQQCYAQGQYEAVHQHVHKLHGATCYCGMGGLQSILSRFETALKGNQVSEYPALMTAMTDEFNAIERHYQEHYRDG